MLIFNPPIPIQLGTMRHLFCTLSPRKPKATRIIKYLRPDFKNKSYLESPKTQARFYFVTTDAIHMNTTFKELTMAL